MIELMRISEGNCERLWQDFLMLGRFVLPRDCWSGFWGIILGVILGIFLGITIMGFIRWR